MVTRLLAVGCWLLAVGGSALTANSQQPTANSPVVRALHYVRQVLHGADRRDSAGARVEAGKESTMFYIALWLLGVPLAIIVLLWLLVIGR